MKCFKRGFTLAEVLITLVIIGVVAALTLPVLLTTISNKIKERKIQVIERKINKGTDLLNIENGIGPYYSSTLDFVNALSKHLKIVTICDSEHLNNCFPYSNFTKRNNSSVNVNGLDLRTSLNIANNNDENEFAETVGIVLADGTPMFLSFNTKCSVHDPDSAVQDTTDCIAGLYDLNGPKGPNKIGIDLVNFNSGCSIDLGDVCYTKPFLIKGGTKEQCLAYKPHSNAWRCVVEPDPWAGLLAKCGGYNKVVKSVNLAEIASLAYKKDGKSIIIPDAYGKIEGLVLDKAYSDISGVSIIVGVAYNNDSSGGSWIFGNNYVQKVQFSRYHPNNLYGMCIVD